MKTEELQAEGLQKKYSVTIENKEFEKVVDDKLEHLSKNTKFPGFRPGKTPKAMLKQRYRSSVLSEAFDEIVNNTVTAVVKEKKLALAMQPKVKVENFEDGKDIKLEITAEIMPEITVGDFSAIVLDKFVADVPEAEIKKAIDYIVHSRRETVKVEDPEYKAQKGDSVVIDFVGSVDGKEFEGGKANGHPLELGSGAFIPGFEDQLIGAKAGDKVDVKVKFPDNYHAQNLAGKDAIFAVEVKAVRQPKTIEVNDDFAKSIGEKDLASLQENVKKRIAADYDRASKLKLKRQLLDKLDDAYNFDVPAGLVEAEFKTIADQYEHAKKHNQLDEHEKSTPEDELMAEYKKIAVRRVKLGLLLSKIGEQSKIGITNEDITQAIINEAKKYPGQEKVVLDYYKKNSEAVEALKAPIMEEKLIEHVLGKVRINEKKVSVEELYKFDEE